MHLYSGATVDFVSDATRNRIAAKLTDAFFEACSYLHNMTFAPVSALFDTRFGTLLQQWPAFTGDRADDLASFLDQQLLGGDGLSVLDRVLKGRYRPHKRLLDHTARIIRREP